MQKIKIQNFHVHLIERFCLIMQYVIVKKLIVLKTRKKGLLSELGLKIPLSKIPLLINILC